jgi:hypothetical protein
MVGKFKRTEVLLDNQADVRVIHQTLLREVEPAEEDVRINGVGGHQFTVEDTGYLDDFFRIYANTETHANVLSFAEVEDHFPITYVPRESFTVHLQDRDIEEGRCTLRTGSKSGQRTPLRAFIQRPKSYELKEPMTYSVLAGTLPCQRPYI